MGKGNTDWQIQSCTYYRADWMKISSLCPWSRLTPFGLTGPYIELQPSEEEAHQPDLVSRFHNTINTDCLEGLHRFIVLKNILRNTRENKGDADQKIHICYKSDRLYQRDVTRTHQHSYTCAALTSSMSQSARHHQSVILLIFLCYACSRSIWRKRRRKRKAKKVRKAYLIVKSPILEK